jgi:antitoxin component of RelBE/YafQ-DinJ toxin-antitoxin module
MNLEDQRKLINFRVPNDLRIAFDEVCYQQDLTRTQSLTRLMKKFIEEGSLENQKSLASIRNQIDRYKIRQETNLLDGYLSSNESGFDSEENWILVEEYF